MAAHYAVAVADDQNRFGRMGRLLGDNCIPRSLDPTDFGGARFSVYDEDGVHLLDFHMENRDE
jgi:hypothetical protein